VLAYTSGVIGAVPRMGKSFALRELLLVGALDPRVLEYVYDLKGTGDLSALKLIAHRYGVGDEPEDIAAQLADMRELRQELRRRVKVIRSLPDEVCPDRKVTSALASRRELKLEPILVGVDECQVWFEHEDKAVREEFTAICTDLVKRGPAVGIMIYLATQKPSAKAIPTAIADNAIIRLCFKVMTWQSNDQVLGTGAHQSGIRATMFASQDKGIAYFKGEGPETEIVRTVVGLDAPAATKVATRAYAARKQAGRLTGSAAGQEMEREVEEVVLVDDVRRVVGHAEAMHLTDVATGLAELRPGVYGALSARALGSQLRVAGVRTGDVYDTDKPRSRANGKGVRREWLDVDTTLQVGNEDPGEESFTDRQEGGSAH
jgi:S-DNA-T family DNA segregation ATPase FtsK/SpoIIIE